MEKIFTSESVTQGHPDKICDRVSDAILDELLKKDSFSRVACETVCTTGLIMVFGEISTGCCVDYKKIVKRVVKDIGYTDFNKFSFDYKNCAILLNLDEQSVDISDGIFEKEEERLNQLKAADQGIVFGFACNETKALMPMPIYYAHELAKRLDFVRKQKIIPYLGPDGKTQISVRYFNGAPLDISAIVVSSQHLDGVSNEKIRKDILENVIFKTIPKQLITKKTLFFVNPSKRFVIGGPKSDSGLTGRKVMVDTYGGYARHGGGAFSGKDATKLDRSGAYFARYVAKNIVAANLAKKCEVSISYAIGVLNPVSVNVETFNTGVLKDDELTKLVKNVFDFRPLAIIKKLDLLNPIYEQLSCYGHFGREDLNVLWEKTDAKEALKNSLKNNLTLK